MNVVDIPTYSKLYILIKDWVDVGHAANSAAHASLMLYLKYKDHPNMKEWLENSFRKVTCEVTEQQFEEAKQFDDHVVVTENNLDNQEVALIFLPRVEWPPFFKYLKLYGKVNDT